MSFELQYWLLTPPHAHPTLHLPETRTPAQLESLCHRRSRSVRHEVSADDARLDDALDLLLGPRAPLRPLRLLVHLLEGLEELVPLLLRPSRRGDPLAHIELPFV